MLNNKLYLFGVPLLNAGVVFRECDLSFRIDRILDDIRTLLPDLVGIADFELTHEIKVGENQLILNVFLVETLQTSFDFNKSKTLLEVKEVIINAIKRLPMKLNLMVLDDQSLGSQSLGYSGKKEAENLKKLMQKNQKSSLTFLLADEDLDLLFPEMVPYVIDTTVRHIQFKVEYIHSRYVRIRLLFVDTEKLKNKKYTHLMTGKKIHDDDFYHLLTYALRSQKIVACNAMSYLDNFSGQMIAMEAL